MGGNRMGVVQRIGNIMVVFIYVAMWHDCNWKLLTWGWVVGIAFIPEILCSTWSKPLVNKWYYRHLAAMGGALNVYMVFTRGGVHIDLVH